LRSLRAPGLGAFGRKNVIGEKIMDAINAISRGRLPLDMKDRDRFVGVRVIRSGPKGQYFQARFSIPNALLADIGKPQRVSIRGTPQNGYIITAGDDLKPTVVENTSVVYLNVSAERINMPRDERAVIWVRTEIEKNMLRIPPLPPTWIAGKGETPGSERKISFDEARTEPAPVGRSESVAVDYGRPGNGHGGPTTSPLPKRTIDYQMPEGISLDEAQALLARKLEEARVIIRELEKRSGLRLTLTRNFQIVVDLSGR
jgi:hypothetical protein